MCPLHSYEMFRSIHPFRQFLGKHICRSLFFSSSHRHTANNLLKWDLGFGVVLWVFWIFWETVFIEHWEQLLLNISTGRKRLGLANFQKTLILWDIWPWSHLLRNVKASRKDFGFDRFYHLRTGLKGVELFIWLAANPAYYYVSSSETETVEISFSTSIKKVLWEFWAIF